MGSIVLQQQVEPSLNKQYNHHCSSEDNSFLIMQKISRRDNHHHHPHQYLSTSSMMAFEEIISSHSSDDDVIDEAIVVQDEGHQEKTIDDDENDNNTTQTSNITPPISHHSQLEELEEYDHAIVDDNNTHDSLFRLGSSSHEGSSTRQLLFDQARKNKTTTRRILPPSSIIQESASTFDSNINTTTFKQYQQHQYNYDHHTNKQVLLGMNERSNSHENINNSNSLVDQYEQACEQQQEKQNTTTPLRKTCHEEILLHNSNDSIIIRSYNYETDEKQVNKIFVEGIKSIVPTYLQTFYLFIHHFGIIQVFSILSLFYISSFIFQFGIIKLFFNPDDQSLTTTSLLSIILSFTNLSASSTIYAIISTFITCTSMVILILCGLSKYVDYSARSYIYQQFKFSDMSNIQKFYIWDEDNHFWVAQLKSTGEIVGTIGVRKRPNQEDTVELKRMSVSSSMKRKGVASLMLNHLVKWSKEKGYKIITLSTSSLQAAAVDFYKKNGFSIVKMRRYSRFLPTAHLTFEKHL